ncbi:hypothetical protein KJ848_01630 [Patescibacteria group bacterium]|nr:hypothetical protein [Patescibacteria group bacterium]MBU2158862.1 hypothetical protein [Patescibacteria group bacterium]
MRLLLLSAALVLIVSFPQWGNAGAGHNLSGWAWSSTIGWVSFNSTNTGGTDYGVSVAANGRMSGHAWSPNIGWISFNSSDLGGCPSGACSAEFNKQTGTVTGWARALAGTGPSVQTGDWGGWIQLSGNSYAVSAANCEWQGEAWGGGPSLSNGVIGWLSFKGSGYGVIGTGDACVQGSGTDLTAGGITPTGAIAGQSTTLSGTVTNIGGAVASASDTYFLLKNSGGKTVYSTTVNIPAIQPGAGDTRSFSYTFPAEGTYQAQVCGDWYGTVVETNEANNCGPLTAISVTSVVNANGVTCSVSNTSANLGGSVTYTASPSGAAGSPYTWLAPDGATGFGSAGTVTRTFSAAGNYGMQVTASGANLPGVCPVVSVAACTGTRTVDITAVPARVRPGSSTTLSWTAAGINTSCVITGPGISQTIPAASCTVPAGSSPTGTINTQSTYRISCDNGAITDSVIVNVIPEFEEF